MSRRPWLAAAAVAVAHVVTLAGLLTVFPPQGATAASVPDLVRGMPDMPGMPLTGHGVSHGRCADIALPARQSQCHDSLLPPSFPAMDMGVPDRGLPPRGHGGMASSAHSVSLEDLRGPSGTPDRTFDLTAAMGSAVIGGVPTMTFNGQTPGPTLSVRQGDLIDVRLHNTDVIGGVTIHWHGVDVPGAEDGVAGVTQDAVLPGQEHTYRFVVPDAGTYWYHTHQNSVRGVARGLFGAFIVLPRDPDAEATVADVVAVVHTYGSEMTINGLPGESAVPAAVDSTARVRVVNSDNGPVLVAASGAFTVAALDGTDLAGATPVSGPYVLVPAGGRADLLVRVDATGVRVGVVGGPTMVLGPTGQEPAPPLQSTSRFDPLAYGTPGGASDAAARMGKVRRSFAYTVGLRRGYVDGKAGQWYTINGRMIPYVPMYVVRTGEVVRMRITNRTTVPHPIHLHGHHILVLARDGAAATGAVWLDSLEVDPQQSYVVQFVADNPGVWMFHCHNLPHARSGLMTHLMYEGVTTPYRIGRAGGRLVNRPE